MTGIDMQTAFGQAALTDVSQAAAYQQGMQSQAVVYQIKGRPAFAYGDLYLQHNQSIIADSTALLWMDGDVRLETECSGGCFHSWLRQCSGEPCCFNRYTGTGPNQRVTVGFELPGDLMAFGVTHKNGWKFTYDAFVAGTSNLIISSTFSDFCACCCADETPFLTTARVKEGEYGLVLAGGYGMVERHDIPNGETLLVSRGLFFATHEDTPFRVGLVGGCLNLCCTGGGIVLKFSGPSVVYTQSKNPVQLLRDFGIPGGKKSNIKFAKMLKVLSSVASKAGKAGGAAAKKGKKK